MRPSLTRSMVLWAALIASACQGQNDKDPECDDLAGQSCTAVGIPSAEGFGYCDECEELWKCTTDDGSEGELVRWEFPCSCIGSDGVILWGNAYDPDDFETIPGACLSGWE
ncbi:MAG: hypothetical protein H6742_18700 [Alphaproteobacteria bacterium]|nr:hypothetical protein [Alphaproteobacteria bacterium]